MFKGNKGEWSEFYTFIKLLVDKKIIGANENLKKMDAVFFPILKIIREESDEKSEFELQKNGTVKIVHSNGDTSVVEGSDLKIKVVEIFKVIAEESKTFSVPIAEELIKRFGLKSLNAGNSRKEDIVLKIHDHTIGQDHEVGFSIKSRLGSPATLLNASKATNLTYEITGLDFRKIKKINAIDSKSKIKDRLSLIYKEKGSFKFSSVDSGVFEKNLRKIDTVMPEIIAEVLLAYYSNNGKTLPELVKCMRDDDVNILNFNLSSEDYAYKLKALLNDAALGMVPASIWDGSLRAHGGVIIVREDGEIVCYHLYNAEAFRNYLFNNTRLESPSATRHEYGSIYEKDSKMFIKLNLQIRFIK
jgi:type II restriction enzyme